MEDVIIDFLFGFSESKIARKFKNELEKSKEKDDKEKMDDLFVDQTVEFDYANHKASEISLRIFNNMKQKP